MKKIISLITVALLFCTGFMLSGCAAKGPELEQLKSDLKTAGYYDNMLPDSIKAIQLDLYAQALELTDIRTEKKTIDKTGRTVYNCTLTFENDILYIEAGYAITYQGDDVTTVDRINTDRFVRFIAPSRVSEIENDAYQGNTDINELVVENGVTGIGESAFANCTALKKITIGGDVTMLSTAAFKGCTALESVALTGVYPLAILKECFSGCTALKEFTFSSELEFIGSYVFADCAVEKLEFPDSVYEFSASCFLNCKNLKSINITKEMSVIDPTAFEGCDALSKITVSPENTIYKMDGKNLVEIATGSVIFTLK